MLRVKRGIRNDSRGRTERCAGLEMRRLAGQRSSGTTRNSTIKPLACLGASKVGVKTIGFHKTGGISSSSTWLAKG